MKTLRNILAVLTTSTCLAFAGIQTEWSYTIGANDFSPNSNPSPEYGITEITVGASGHSVIVIQRAFTGIVDETRIAMLDPKGARIWLSNNLESLNPSSNFTPFKTASISPGAATFTVSTGGPAPDFKMFAFNLNSTPQFSTLSATNQIPAGHESFINGYKSITSVFPPNTFYTVLSSLPSNPGFLGRTVRKYKVETVSSTVILAESVSGTDGDNFLIKWQSAVNVEYQVQESANLSVWTSVGQPITGNGAQLSWSTPLGTGNKYYRIIQL